MSDLELLNVMVSYYNDKVDFNEKYGLDNYERLEGMFELIIVAKKAVMNNVGDIADNVGYDGGKCEN